MSGKLSQRKGVTFENIVFSTAYRQGFHPIRIPLGAKQVGMGKLIRVRTDFDMILVHDQKALFLDLKCTKAKSFPFSSQTEHQIQSLAECEKRGHTAGYLVNFELINQIVFFSASKFKALSRGSLKPEDGICLGTEMTFDLKRLLGPS